MRIRVVLTASTAEQAAEWADQEAQYRIETYAENGWLRAAENNAQYAWEDEQDGMRAAFFGGS